MPFVLILIGVLVMVAAIRDQLGALGTLLRGDFSGNGNFLYWMAALLVLGGIGYVTPLTRTSRALLALVIVVLFLGNSKGFFARFTAALNQPAPPAASEAAVGQALPDSGSGGGSSGGASTGGITGEIGAIGGSLVGGPIGGTIGKIGGDLIGGLL